MIKKLICLLWGHKTVHKGYTGETMRQSNGFGMTVDVALYQFTRTRFCTRCGKEVHPSNPGCDRTRHLVAGTVHNFVLPPDSENQSEGK